MVVDFGPNSKTVTHCGYMGGSLEVGIQTDEKTNQNFHDRRVGWEIKNL